LPYQIFGRPKCAYTLPKSRQNFHNESWLDANQIGTKIYGLALILTWHNWMLTNQAQNFTSRIENSSLPHSHKHTKRHRLYSISIVGHTRIFSLFFSNFFRPCLVC
jgi:hypothetical protein